MNEQNRQRQADTARGLSTPELVGQILERTQTLFRAEIALAKTEAREQIRAELKAAIGLGIGALFGLFTLMLLFTTAVLALALVMPGWAAALIMTGVAGIIAAIAAATGWSKRVRVPLERTRRTTKEDVAWTKEQTH